MELQLLWAGVRFSARNGNGEGLLSEAARTGLHLSEVTPQPGGFAARCAAWRYRKLAALARKRRVRLHIAQRTGLYFFLRPFSGGGGSGRDCCSSFPCCCGRRILSGLWIQQPFRRAASTGQADPAGSVLDCPRQLHHAGKADRRGIRPFAERRVFVGEPEFSGRTARGGSGRRKAGAGHRRRKAGRVLAKTAGTVVRTNLTGGTMLVTPGQAVEAGQPSSAQPAQSGTAPPSSNPPPGPSSPDSIGSTCRQSR